MSKDLASFCTCIYFCTVKYGYCYYIYQAWNISMYLQGPRTPIDAFQRNIFFSWFNDILIKSQWILGSSDREILYKTFSFCLINLTWPPGPQKEKVKKCYGMWVIWLVLSESWKRLESGGYKVCFCFDWSINQTENSLNLSDMDIKIGKLSIFYQISPSQDSKNNLILLRMSFNHKESSSEMHQFECTL